MNKYDMCYDLSCRYDSRKSFYGKAKVYYNDNIKELYSYGMLVASVELIDSYFKYNYYGKYSQTTTRHQKEFFYQEGLNDKEIKELFKNGNLIIKMLQ